MAIPPGTNFKYGKRKETERILGQQAPQAGVGKSPLTPQQLPGAAPAPFSNPVEDLKGMASPGQPMLPPSPNNFGAMSPSDFENLSPFMRWVGIAQMSKSPRARRRARLWLMRRLHGSF